MERVCEDTTRRATRTVCDVWWQFRRTCHLRILVVLHVKSGFAMFMLASTGGICYHSVTE